MEDETILGKVKEVAETGGSGFDNLRKVLPRGGPGGDTLWVRNLGADSSNAAKTRGGTRGFPASGDGDDVSKVGVKTWQKESADRVIQAEGNKHIWEYTQKRQSMVVEWVELWPIFEGCENETRYKGGGRLLNQWWRQTDAEQNLNTTLKGISAAVWEQQRRESGRRGGGG